MIYELFNNDTTLRIGKFYKANSNSSIRKAKTFKAINISLLDHPRIIWYTPDFPDRIRNIEEKDFALLDKYIKMHKWPLDCKAFLKEIITDYVLLTKD